MWKIEQVFQLKFQPACIQNADCDIDDRKCVCNNGQDGKFCSDEQSKISTILKRNNVAGYEADKDVNEVFESLNQYSSNSASDGIEL